MKFSIQKNKFLEALNIVSRALSPTPVFEVLKGIKIEVRDSLITFKTSDSLISIEYLLNKYEEDYVIFDVYEEGDAVIPSRNFIDIIRKAPENEINIEVTNNVLKIQSGKSEFNIQTYDVNDYPDFPVVSKEKNIALNSVLLNNIIKETIFCTAQSDQRPILEGVNFILEDGFLTATSTDSHRLSRRKVLLENLNKEQDFNLILPRKSLQSIQKLIENKENNVEIFYEDNRVVFVVENVIYTVLLISGKYPNTEKLIPSLYECNVTVPSHSLYNAVDRISLVSRDDKNDIVKLLIKDATINISSQSKELGRAEEEIFANVESDSEVFEISVSAKFLKEAISAINSEEVVIKFSGELTAFTMQPSDYHRDIVEVLLPVRTY